MNLIKPKQLKIGDKITIIAPSGTVDINLINKAKTYFENKGFKVDFGKNINNKSDYLAGSDKDRIEDLHNAFKDKDTKAIICARGGYGALRLLDKIDYEIIKNNPKIFCGYSDITLLNAIFLKRANLITFSGPRSLRFLAIFITSIFCTFAEKRMGLFQQPHSLLVNHS